jgi:hypothetical protein
LDPWAHKELLVKQVQLDYREPLDYRVRLVKWVLLVLLVLLEHLVHPVLLAQQDCRVRMVWSVRKVLLEVMASRV